MSNPNKPPSSLLDPPDKKKMAEIQRGKADIAEATRKAVQKATEAKIQDPKTSSSASKPPSRTSSTDSKAPARQSSIGSDDSLEKRLREADLNKERAKKTEPMPASRTSTPDPKREKSKQPASRSSSVSETDYQTALELIKAAPDSPRKAYLRDGARDVLEGGDRSEQSMSRSEIMDRLGNAAGVLDATRGKAVRGLAAQAADLGTWQRSSDSAAWSDDSLKEQVRAQVRAEERDRAGYGESTFVATGLGQIDVDDYTKRSRDTARRPQPTFAGLGLSQLGEDMDRAAASKSKDKNQQSRKSSMDVVSATGYEGDASEVSGNDTPELEEAAARTRRDEARRMNKLKYAPTPTDSEVSLSRETPGKSAAKSGGRSGDKSGGKAGAKSGDKSGDKATDTASSKAGGKSGGK